MSLRKLFRRLKRNSCKCTRMHYFIAGLNWLVKFNCGYSVIGRYIIPASICLVYNPIQWILLTNGLSVFNLAEFKNHFCISLHIFEIPVSISLLCLSLLWQNSYDKWTICIFDMPGSIYCVYLYYDMCLSYFPVSVCVCVYCWQEHHRIPGLSRPPGQSIPLLYR